MISELSSVVQKLPKDVSLNLIDSACIITNKCKQLDKNVDIDSLERIEINLQQLQKAN